MDANSRTVGKLPPGWTRWEEMLKKKKRIITQKTGRVLGKLISSDSVPAPASEGKCNEKPKSWRCSDLICRYRAYRQNEASKALCTNLWVTQLDKLHVQKDTSTCCDLTIILPIGWLMMKPMQTFTVSTLASAMNTNTYQSNDKNEESAA